MKQAKRNSFQVFVLILFFAAGLFTGCEKKSIDEDTAVKVYVEKLIAEESHSLKPDSVRIQVQNVFSKYNTTQNEFDNYMKSLADKPDELQDFFKKSDEYLVELNKKGIVK